MITYGAPASLYNNPVINCRSNFEGPLIIPKNLIRFIHNYSKTRTYQKYVLLKMMPVITSLSKVAHQCLSKDLETGCLKLAVVKILSVQIFKGDHDILIFQP